MIWKYFDELNTVLVPRTGNDDLIMKPDFSKSIALINKRARERESLDKVSYMTINEKRKQIGLEEIDGGDELLVPFNLVPLDQLNFGNIEEEKKFYMKFISGGLTPEESKQLTKVVFRNG